MVNYLISETLSSYPNYVALRTVLLSKSLLQSPKTNKKNTTNKKEQAIATGSKLFSKLKTVIFRTEKNIYLSQEVRQSFLNVLLTLLLTLLILSVQNYLLSMTTVERDATFQMLINADITNATD